MSLHAQLSPEALQRLHAQRRNSTISSVAIAVLTVVLVGLLLGVFLLPNMVKDVPVIVTYKSNIQEETTIQEKKVQTSMDRKPSSPSSSMAKVITAATTSATAIPTPDVDVSTPSLDFGDGNDFGSGWSSGEGSGGGFGNVPTAMKKRCSKQDRLARLQESGGTPECEDAVINALQWLKKTQNADGSWDKGHPVAMTGFALLAYLGHCETPQSEEYGDSVSRGITYLVNVGLKNDDRLTNKPADNIQWVYDHGIATYALAEAYTLCHSINVNIPDLDKVTKKAVEMIMDGQADSGGWLYKYADSPNGGDNSVGFWQIQALKASKHTGLISESKLKKHSNKALKFLDSVQGKDGAIGYRNDATRSPGLTGGGMLAFQIWEGSDANIRKGIKYIDKNSEFKWGTPSANLYYHYYNVQAMINYGGSEWTKYNGIFRDELLKAQEKDGSWKQSVLHGPANTHMATCLATLMLEAYYRFLPGSAK
jgi:hypothetical protein